jgi:hypothetical protein
VVQDVWNHLKIGGKAILHVGYEFSRTQEALNQLTNMNPDFRLTVMKNKTDAGMAIHIVLQKTSATDKISLPEIESSLSNKSLSKIINDKVVDIPWSNLYYDYKFAGEKEYKRDKIIRNGFAEGKLKDKT